MGEIDTGRFTIGVFQDVASADRGLEALARHDFPADTLSVVAADAPAVVTLVEKTFGSAGDTMEVRNLGTLRLYGPLIDALQGAERDLAQVGVAATMFRVGFQAHDGFIFETLTARGGVLVAIRSEPRAADALAVLHAYGGGNAAIGAWTGRV